MATFIAWSRGSFGGKQHRPQRHLRRRTRAATVADTDAFKPIWRCHAKKLIAIIGGAITNRVRNLAPKKPFSYDFPACLQINFRFQFESF